MKCQVCSADTATQAKYCKTMECAKEFARRMAWTNVRSEGECEIWLGAFRGKSPCVIPRISPTQRREMRVLSLRTPDIDSQQRVWVNECGEPKCVTVAHNKLTVAPETSPPLVIRHRLPAEPLLRMVDKRDEFISAELGDLVRMARHKGYVTVTTADRICIEYLGLHPANIYGWDFFTVGTKDHVA